jgi:hypothetical protein
LLQLAALPLATPPLPYVSPVPSSDHGDQERRPA